MSIINSPALRGVRSPFCLDLKDPSLACYLPFWYPYSDLRGSTIYSYDRYRHSCAVTGTTWGIQGRLLDGTDDHIDCGNAVSLRLTGNATWMAWVKPTIGASQAIISKENGVADRGFNFVILDTGSTRIVVAINATTNAYFSTTNALTTAVWQHVAAVYNGSTLVIYVNGVSWAGTTTGTVPATQRDSTANVYIGEAPNGTLDYTGNIGEKVVFSVVKDVSFIGRHYWATKWRYV